jgi:hypothetical protein
MDLLPAHVMRISRDCDIGEARCFEQGLYNSRKEIVVGYNYCNQIPDELHRGHLLHAQFLSK